MAWQYADFEEQATTALRIAQLRRHLSEVQQRISASVSAGSMSRDASTLNDYAKSLRERLTQFEGYPDAAGTIGGGVSVARFVD